MNDDPTKRGDYAAGVACVLACQVLWGFLPVYWRALIPIDSKVIILYRIVTMFACCLAAARFKYGWARIFGPLKNFRTLLRYFVVGTMLTANWSLYIWAINSGRIIQTSIGYYIEPLAVCLFGIAFFREKVTKYNLSAMLLALVAVILILIHFGQVPLVALGLALTWASYSALKKTVDQPVMISLVYETIVYAALALAAIVTLEARGEGALSCRAPGKYALMLLSGLVTCVPVGLFSVSARKVGLFMLGLAQYVSPTITLLLGIFLIKEPVDAVQLRAFAIIWIGLVVFTVGEFKKPRS